MHRTGYTDPYSEANMSSGVVAATLNVAMIVNDTSGAYWDTREEITLGGVSGLQYKVALQAFRCFEGKEYGTSACYSDTSTLSVFVPNTLLQKEFHSNSKVSFDGSTFSSGMDTFDTDTDL